MLPDDILSIPIIPPLSHRQHSLAMTTLTLRQQTVGRVHTDNFSSCMVHGRTRRISEYWQLQIMTLKLIGFLNIWGLSAIILMTKQKKSKPQSQLPIKPIPSAYCFRCKHTNRNNKIRFYETLTNPVLYYRSVTWSLTQMTERKYFPFCNIRTVFTHHV